MKVIFLKQVPRVAKKYEVKDVANGYALNYLFPQKAAEMATDKALARLEELRAAHKAEEQVQADLLAKNIDSLNAVEIMIEAKVNEKGHLFASIHKEDLVEKLFTDAHLTVPLSSIELPRAIKEVGEHSIEVKAGDKSAHFKVIVNAL